MQEVISGDNFLLIGDHSRLPQATQAHQIAQGHSKVSHKSRGTPPRPNVTATLILHYKTEVSKRLEILHFVSAFYSH